MSLLLPLNSNDRSIPLTCLYRIIQYAALVDFQRGQNITCAAATYTVLALKSHAQVPLTHREKPILVFVEDPAQQLQKP
jgi:hypothetical protein